MNEVEAAEGSAIATDHDRPRLHIHPDHGWLNDPNGLCRIDGTYHVFFQYNPAGPVHDDIHWGHVSSPDLLHWTPASLALAPSAGGPDRGGCWSGCIVDDGGVPTAVYTAIRASAQDAGVALARSDRSLHEWVVDHDWRVGTPGDPAITDVRDPFVFSYEGRRYAVQGAGRFGGSPQLLLYACDDLTEWTYLGPLLTTDDPIAAAVGQANIWECPNLFPLGDSWVLLLSLWRDDVLSGVRYLVGDLVTVGDGLRFAARSGGTPDAGPTFYAPQVLVEPDRVLLWGWAWEGADRSVEEIQAAGWCGTLTSPREVLLHDGEVTLPPAAEVIELRRELLPYAPGATLGAEAFEVLAQRRVRLRLVDRQTGDEKVVADVHGPVRVLVDGSLVEVFGPGTSSTTRAYPRGRSDWFVDTDGPLEVWRLDLPD